MNRGLLAPVLAMAFGLAGCEPADLGVQLTPDNGTRTVTIGVSAEGAGTKAEIDNNLIFSWTAGDRIAVWAGSEGSGQYYTSEAYTGGNTYQISLSGTRSNYAVYPATIAVADAATATSLKVTLPAEYDFTAVGQNWSPLPMVATNTEGRDLAFKHLGGLLRITAGDLPEGTAYVTVDLGKPINGTFPVHLDDGCYISCEDETITDGSNVTKFLVPSPVPNNLVLNLPVPTGTYESIEVKAYDAGNNLLSSDSPTFSWNCARAHGKKLSSEGTGWVYVFGTLSDASVTYEGGDVALASAFQSYRYCGSEEEEVPFVIEYSLDGETWSEEAPDWLTGVPTSSTGSISGVDLSGSVTAQVNTAVDSHHNILKERSPKADFDLATLNVATGATVNRTTANCYVVQAPGTYKFPLVYGNGVKNGAVNEIAYRGRADNATGYRPDEGEAADPTGSNAGYYMGSFKDHLDNNIYNGGDATSSPYLTTHLNKAASEFTPVLIWTDVPGLINVDAAISGTGENSYLKFSVPAETITQGNALVAVLADGVIAWSWHIWVTDEDLTNLTDINNFKVPQVNLGWCDARVFEFYEGRSCLVRAVQTDAGGKTSDPITVTQTEYAPVGYGGNCTYYQWGRKDPLQAADGTASNKDKTYYDASGNAYTSTSTSDYRPQHGLSGQRSIGEAIREPQKDYYIANANWCSSTYFNLWNSTLNSYHGDASRTAAVTKTIYDPSPVGFKMPPQSLFSGFHGLEWEEINKGLIYNSVLFPVAGYRYTNNRLTNVTIGGRYWTAAPEFALYAATLTIDIPSQGKGTVKTPNESFMNRGYAVRPVAENDIIVTGEGLAGWN